MNHIEHRISSALEQRKRKGTIRKLPCSSDSDSSSDSSGDSSIATTTTTTITNNNIIEEEAKEYDAIIIRSSSNSNNFFSSNTDGCIDFSSNDYLGLASDIQQQRLVKTMIDYYATTTTNNNHHHNNQLLGSTGSRLLSGDSHYCHAVERYLAGSTVHHRNTALLFNSGYDANLSVVSCLPCDIILYDEYSHNSLQMGIRLWKSYTSSTSTTNNNKDDEGGVDNNNNNIIRQAYSFQHNNVVDLQQQLINTRNNNKHRNGKAAVHVCIIIESVYSMDGDVADVVTILNLAQQYDAVVIIDEAHGLGVYGSNSITTTTTTTNDDDCGGVRQIKGGGGGFGTGIVAKYGVEDHKALLCTIYTFGKGAGCHGAVVCMNSVQYKEYLINYAYPFIYSTALPFHALVTIECAYRTMTSPTKGNALRQNLFTLVQYFRTSLLQSLQEILSLSNNHHSITLLPSTSPIQALMIPGNDNCSNFCTLLYMRSHKKIKLYPIKSPTVPVGKERVRIVIHANNNIQQIQLLISLIRETIQELLFFDKGEDNNQSKTSTTTTLSKL